MGRRLLLLAAVFFFTPALAQTPRLITDAGTVTGNSNPGFFASDGLSLAAFAATDQNGTSLWLTDGTAEGTAPILFGPDGYPTIVGQTSDAGADPHITFAGDAIYFFADGAAEGNGLWRMHRVERRPVLVKSFPRAFSLLAGSRAIYAISDRSIVFRWQTQGEVWVTDGTTAGTRTVSGIGDAVLVPVGARVFYGSGSELRIIEGNAEAPRTVMTLPMPLRGLTAAGDLAIFSIGDSSNGELWRSDGTASGTYRLRTFAVPSLDLQSAGTAALFQFRANGASELWSTRGTEESTTKIATFTTTVSVIGSVNGRTLFRGNDQLWITDGTEAGTQAFRPSAFVTAVASTATHLFFAEYTEGAHSLWVFDGTAAGTRHVADVSVFAGAGLPAGTAIGHRIIFAGSDDARGRELWVAEAPPASARMLVNISADGNLDPAEAARAGTQLFFSGSSGAAGRELWVTDGTNSGTRMVRDIRAGAQSSSPTSLLPFGSSVLFRATTPEFGAEPWISDGTESGTRLLQDLAPGPPGSNPFSRLADGNTAYFQASSGTPSRQRLWRTDGSAAGTSEIAVETSTPLLFDGAVYFRGSLGLMRLRPGETQPQVVFHGQILPIGATVDKLFLVSPGQLWVLERTGELRMVTSFGPGGVVSTLVAAGSRGFFIADDGTHGAEPWITDGTYQGTRMLADIAAGAPSSRPDPPPATPFAPTDQQVAFVASDGVHGYELWVTDGTPSGTWMVRDIRPGPQSSWPDRFFSVDGRIFFSADDGLHGRELWRIDAEGPRLVADLEPGPFGSVPRSMTSLGGSLVFAATTQATGRELWSLSLTPSGRPSRQRACCRR